MCGVNINKRTKFYSFSSSLSCRFGPSALTSTNEEGIEKVRREKFGFILPDTIGDYLANRRPCDLVAVGRFLDRRGYAIALQKSSRSVRCLTSGKFYFRSRDVSTILPRHAV